MKAVRETCGCRHDGQQWIELCPPHRDEELAIHARAAADYRAAAERLALKDYDTHRAKRLATVTGNEDLL